MNVRPAGLLLKDGHFLTMLYRYGASLVYVLPGGNPDPGETLEEALVREWQEELGVTPEVDAMVLGGEVLQFGNKQDMFHCLFTVRMTADQTPVLNTAHTSARDIVWLPVAALENVTLYPNFSAQLPTLDENSGGFRYVGRLHQPYHS